MSDQYEAPKRKAWGRESEEGNTVILWCRELGASPGGGGYHGMRLLKVERHL